MTEQKMMAFDNMYSITEFWWRTRKTSEKGEGGNQNLIKQNFHFDSKFLYRALLKLHETMAGFPNAAAGTGQIQIPQKALKCQNTHA